MATAARKGGVGEGARGGRVMGTFSTSGVVRFVTHHCCDPGDLWSQDPPSLLLLGSLWSKGATAARRLESRVLSSCCYRGLPGALGSATVAKGQDCRHLLHCSLSSTSFMYSSPSTFRSRFLDLSGPSVLGRGTFVDLRMFYKL